MDPAYWTARLTEARARLPRAAPARREHPAQTAAGVVSGRAPLTAGSALAVERAAGNRGLGVLLERRVLARLTPEHWRRRVEGEQQSLSLSERGKRHIWRLDAVLTALDRPASKPAETLQRDQAVIDACLHILRELKDEMRPSGRAVRRGEAWQGPDPHVQSLVWLLVELAEDANNSVRASGFQSVSGQELDFWRVYKPYAGFNV
jgi:hypothetical protein